MLHYTSIKFDVVDNDNKFDVVSLPTTITKKILLTFELVAVKVLDWLTVVLFFKMLVEVAIYSKLHWVTSKVWY
jgi:hypothetical protein